jgi:protein AroM
VRKALPLLGCPELRNNGSRPSPGRREEKVAGLLQHHLLGIIVPVAEQMQSESGKWSRLARQPIFASASPYADDLDAVTRAGAELAERGAEALLLDCIGFTERHRTALAETGLPVILSNAIVAKAVGELFGG